MNLNCFALNKNHLVLDTGNKGEDFDVTSCTKYGQVGDRSIRRRGICRVLFVGT